MCFSRGKLISLLVFFMFTLLGSGMAHGKWKCPENYEPIPPFPVGEKACHIPAKTMYHVAIKVRQNTSVGQGCPKDQTWDIKGGEKGMGACWRCPRDYKRSKLAVDGDKACSRKTEARYLPAEKE